MLSVMEFLFNLCASVVFLFMVSAVKIEVTGPIQDFDHLAKPEEIRR